MKGKTMLWTDKDKPITGKETFTTSTDLVQVVRCKDCKQLLIVTNEPLIGLCQLSAPKTLTMWSEDIETHFCGWGERKDDE